MSKHVVVIGGFATGKRRLEPVAEAAITLGLADDAELFTFTQAMDDAARVRCASEDAVVITHSAGIVGVHGDIRPSSLIACNGPEPKHVGRLLVASTHKILTHGGRVIAGPHRRRYGSILASNAFQTTVHPVGNVSRVPVISRFSTLSRLGQAGLAGIDAVAIVASRDKFFPHDPTVVPPTGVEVVEVLGGHDELLVQPAFVLGALVARSQAAHTT